jgi:hypothetical protein
MEILSVIKKARGHIALLLLFVVSLGISTAVSLVPAPKVHAAVSLTISWTSVDTLNFAGSAFQKPPIQAKGTFLNQGGPNPSFNAGPGVLVDMSFGCKTYVGFYINSDASGNIDFSTATAVTFIRDQSGGATCTDAQLKNNISGLTPPTSGATSTLELKNYTLLDVGKRGGGGGGDTTVKVTAGMGPASVNTNLPTTDTFLICAATGAYLSNKTLLDQDCLAQKSGTVSQKVVSGNLQTIADGKGPNNGDEQGWIGTFAKKVAAGNYDVCSANFNACVLVQEPRDKEVYLSIGLPNVTIPGTPPNIVGQSQDTCDNANFTELNFWLCGVIKALSDTVKHLDEAILNALKIDTDGIFNDSGTSRAGNAYFVAWSAFRNIAYAILVILALIMIVSQILGFDFVSAYEFRKQLPKFIIIVLVLAVLWNLQDLAYNASNDGANAVEAIIGAPFSKIDVTIGNTTTNNLSLFLLIPALATIGTAVGAAALLFLGIGGIAALVLSLFLTVGSAWILIEGRNVVADMLIVASPVAVVSAIFGPFKKLYDVWLAASATILLSVPAIAGVLKLGQEAAKLSYINNHIVVAFVILGATYALFWKVFTTLDKVSGQLGNVVSSATGKARKGLADYRSNTRKRRTQEAIEGKREIRGARLATGLLRRANNADQGGFSITRAGRARYRGAEQTHMSNTVAEMMKKDGGRSGGDDDAMEIAQQRGINDAGFMRQYSQRLQARGVGAGEADRRASAALGTLRSSFGSQLGTEAMRVAAYRSLLDSKTSYADPTGANAQDNWEHMIGDGNELMADGLMTATDVTMAIKSRADRADRAGVGFGTLQGQVERSFERHQQGAARGTVTAGGPMAGTALVTSDEAKAMRKEALFGTQAAGIVSGRHEAVSALSGTMRDNVEETYTNLNNARAAEAAAGVTNANRDDILASARAVGVGPLTAQQTAAVDASQAQDQHDRGLAAIAGRYDAMGQVSPQNAEIMANNVMSQIIPGAPVHPDTINGQPNPRAGQAMTVQEMVEGARGRQGFLEMRREYMTAGLAAANAAGGAAAINQPTPGM